MKVEYLKPGHCPICFALIPHPATVNISLNNNTTMPQPVCDTHFADMLEEKTQQELLELCKQVWIGEINSSEQRTEEEKKAEIENITRLEVIYRG